MKHMLGMDQFLHTFKSLHGRMGAKWKGFYLRASAPFNDL